MEKLIIFLIVFMFVVLWINNERGEGFKVDVEKDTKDTKDVPQPKVDDDTRTLKDLYDEIKDKYGLSCMALLKHFKDESNFEKMVKDWINNPNINHTKDTLIKVFEPHSNEPFEPPKPYQPDIDLIMVEQAQYPRLSNGPYMTRQELDMQTVPYDKPWQWILNNGPIRPWEPRYPVMNIAPEPIALIHS
jgi:hypothetical protein